MKRMACDRLLESARELFAPLICARITAKASLLDIQEIIYIPSSKDAENVTIVFDYREGAGVIHNASIKLPQAIVKHCLMQAGRSYGADTFIEAFEDESPKGLFFLDREVCTHGTYAQREMKKRGKL